MRATALWQASLGSPDTQLTISIEKEGYSAKRILVVSSPLPLGEGKADRRSAGVREPTSALLTKALYTRLPQDEKSC